MPLLQQMGTTKRATTNEWSAPVSDEEALRRAVGRDNYNTRRRIGAMLRREQEIRLWHESLEVGGPGIFGHGVRAGIARELRVHRSTVTRDFQHIFSEWEVDHCPNC